jgi:hypothetical protein
MFQCADIFTSGSNRKRNDANTSGFVRDHLARQRLRILRSGGCAGNCMPAFRLDSLFTCPFADLHAILSAIVAGAKSFAMDVPPTSEKVRDVN